MRLPLPRRAPPSEPLLPMINVVFLLLIFFLILAQITPPPPVDTTPPESDAVPTDAALDAPAVLWIDATGALVHDGAREDAALEALLAQSHGAVLIRADAGAPATRLAQVLQVLGAAGVTQVDLITLVRPRAAP